MPMTTELLDTASAEKAKLHKAPSDESRIESPYLLLTSTNSNNREYRTGRFSDEEMDFCDFLMQNFDKGYLPMGAGVRLNDFLCNALLCKASRLTKKMKNAKLGSRSYELLSQDPNKDPLNFELFTKLQERFLNSVTSLSVRCELRFQMEKLWRSNLSSLCIQLGSKLLDASDWIANLEEMEQRGAQAEENIRKARRRRMGLALKTDVGASPGVFFSGFPVQLPSAVAPLSAEEPNLKPSGSSFTSHNTVTSSESERTHHIHNMLDLDERKPSTVPSDTIDDFASFFDDLIDEKPTGASSLSIEAKSRRQSGTFLEEVMGYIEQHELPFQHADVWVPSYFPGSHKRPEDLRLFHSGHATPSSADPIIACQLVEYGEYSTKFSFASGVGLPGRVYKSGESSWECRLDLADPKVFERAGGAGVYGIKTGIGIALSSSLVGRIVLCLYSLDDLEVNASMLKLLENDIAAYCPKPTWKLVVDMDSDSLSSKSTTSLPEALPPALHGGRMHTDSISVNSNSTNHSQTKKSTSRDVELSIAKLLTDFLPGASLPGVMTDKDDGLLPFYMSLRLSLLRNPDRRCTEENNKLEVIRSSYEGFMSSPSRSKRHIADMIVRDWRFLKTNTEGKEPNSGQHQTMIMNEPRVQTYAPNGAPTRVPFALGDPTERNNKKRRISEAGEVNIVDDLSS